MSGAEVRVAPNPLGSIASGWRFAGSWVALVAVLAACPGCRRQGGRGVNLVGSTSIQPFAELLAEEFHHVQPQANVPEVQGGGSTAGIQALRSGIADIGMCSRALKPEEAAELRPIVIARDGLAVIVHRSNPVGALSLLQVRGIFSGQITNWRDVGGRDMPVRPIVREEGSGTREAFMHSVMGKSRVSRKALVQESNGSVKELVHNDPGAVGFMSLGLVGHEVKAVAVDGVPPTPEAVTAGRYPLARPFLFVVKGDVRPEMQAFIDFALSAQGQKLLESEGLVRAR